MMDREFQLSMSLGVLVLVIQNRQMLRDRSSRRREFDDVRSTLNASCGSLSQHHLTPYRAEKKPSKWNIAKGEERQFQNQREMRKSNLNSSFNKSMTLMPMTPMTPMRQVEVMNKPIHQHKVRQFCVNCVNKLISEKKKQERYEEQQKERQLEKENIQREKTQITMLEREHQERLRREREALKPKPSIKKCIQKPLLGQERERKAEILRQQEADLREEREREIARENHRKEKFNRELRQQVEDNRKRKREEKQMDMRMDQQFQIPQDYTGVAVKNRSQMYKQELDQQIKVKQLKAKKEKEQEKRLEEHNARLIQQESDGLQGQSLVRESNYAEDLRRQIEERRETRRKEYIQDRKREEVTQHLTEQALWEQTKAQTDIKNRLVENYIGSLNNQIHINRNKRIQEKEFEKTSIVAPAQELKGDCLEDCDNCHNRFPKKYLSIVDVS